MITYRPVCSGELHERLKNLISLGYTIKNHLLLEVEEEYSPVARLIELGRQKKYVTIDDILLVFPEAEKDVEQLEEAFPRS
jgi:hypothetical protein